MLSRVASSLYWMNRYIERAENTARFVDVNLRLLLDLPGGSAEPHLGIGRVTYETAQGHPPPMGMHRRQPVFGCERHDPWPVRNEETHPHHDDSLCASLRRGPESTLQIIRTFHVQSLNPHP